MRRSHDRGVGFGPLLSFDADWTLVRRRLPGALPWGAPPPQDRERGEAGEGPRDALRGPGYYDVSWRAVEPGPRGPDFERFTGHVLVGGGRQVGPTCARNGSYHHGQGGGCGTSAVS